MDIVVKSSEIWRLVDSWNISTGSDIQKFCMMADVLNLTHIKIEFNVPNRDPINDGN